MLAELYGNTWEFVHGDSSSDSLRQFLNSLDQDRAKRVFEYCREQIAKGNKFAPNLGELIVFADTPTETEYFLILNRVKLNKPEGEIETYLAENIRYNLKRVSEQDELRYLKQQYRNAQALKQVGGLTTSQSEILALPRVSVKNLNDIHRERFDGVLNPRIAKILGK